MIDEAAVSILKEMFKHAFMPETNRERALASIIDDLHVCRCPEKLYCSKHSLDYPHDRNGRVYL